MLKYTFRHFFRLFKLIIEITLNISFIKAMEYSSVSNVTKHYEDFITCIKQALTAACSNTWNMTDSKVAHCLNDCSPYLLMLAWWGV